MPRLSIEVSKITGQGVNIQRVVDGLRKMKSELEALGCKVMILVEGVELKADLWEEGAGRKGKPRRKVHGRIPKVGRIGAGRSTEAGNGTRTRDILLGKKGVMVEGEPVATPQTENEVAE